MNLITLQNKNNFTLIQDLVILPLKINRDDSGTLVETLRTDWKEAYGKGREFFMQYYTKVPSGIAKDYNSWHYHTHQEDRIVLLQGEIIFVVADKRKTSTTKDKINLFYMKAEISPFMLIVPKKTLHGFVVVSKENAILINFPTALYDPNDNIDVPFKKSNIHISKNSLFSWDKVLEIFNQNRSLHE